MFGTPSTQDKKKLNTPVSFSFSERSSPFLVGWFACLSCQRRCDRYVLDGASLSTFIYEIPLIKWILRAHLKQCVWGEVARNAPG